MDIHEALNWDGQTYQLRYFDTDSFDDLPYEQCTQVYGVCFIGNQMVIGFGGKTDYGWGMIGGSIEPGETYEQTLVREVAEEANMRVLTWLPVGVQEVTNPDGSITYQLRTVALVEKIGEFEFDPAGSVEKIKLINPANYKDYFDWGKIGERIINRAVELKDTL